MKPSALGRRRALLQLAALALAGVAAGCGFAPLHDGGAGGAPGRSGAVWVEPVAGEAGFALRERLVERLGPSGPDASRRLHVELAFVAEGGLLSRGDATARTTVTGIATARLYGSGAAEPALTEVFAARTGYSTPPADGASAFAARAAARAAEERVAQTLADRIALRLALLERTGLPAPGS
jgi:LPS-assembly lipoprotein